MGVDLFANSILTPSIKKLLVITFQRKREVTFLCLCAFL